MKKIYITILILIVSPTFVLALTCSEQFNTNDADKYAENTIVDETGLGLYLNPPPTLETGGVRLYMYFDSSGTCTSGGYQSGTGEQAMANTWLTGSVPNVEPSLYVNYSADNAIRYYATTDSGGSATIRWWISYYSTSTNQWTIVDNEQTCEDYFYQTDCENANCYWNCDDSQEAQDMWEMGVYTCSCNSTSTGTCGGEIWNCQYCNSTSTCETAGYRCHWDDDLDGCYPLADVCGSGFQLEFCDNEAECLTNGGYWCSSYCTFSVDYCATTATGTAWYDDVIGEIPLIGRLWKLTTQPDSWWRELLDTINLFDKAPISWIIDIKNYLDDKKTELEQGELDMDDEISGTGEMSIQFENIGTSTFSFWDLSSISTNYASEFGIIRGIANALMYIGFAFYFISRIKTIWIR